MKLKRIAYYLGRILLVGAVLMLAPVIVSLVYGDGCVPSFVISAAILAAVSAAFILIFRRNNTALSSKEGMVVAALTWIFISVAGALPLMLSGAVPRFADAFFDTVSGFTTTGATVLTTIDTLPPSIIFWRSFSHWVGGLGILAFAVAVLPRDRGGVAKDGSASATSALRAESPGPTFGKLVSKLKFNSQILYAIYLGLTVAEAILLILGKMPVFDSICNSLATMGSGGFFMRDFGIAGYNSAYIEWVIGIFMLIAGVNFNFFYFMLIRKFSKALLMEEVRWYIGIIASSTVMITANLISMYGSLAETVRHAFFQVCSIISTTGFSTVDFDKWPEFSKMILLLLMFIGGCAGSTAGGIKISRIVIMLKTGLKEIRYCLNPREVRVIHFEGEALDRAVTTGVSSYFLVYMILYGLSLLLVSLDGHDFTTTFSAVAACINNVGPGFGGVGPASNFSCMSDFSKYVLSFNMLLGRLEIFPMLVLISPASWRK